MRVVSEPNRAFADQPTPILPAKIKAVTARAKSPVADLPFRLGITASGAPSVVAARDDAEGGMQIAVSGAAIGKHCVPPNIETRAIKSLGNRSPGFDEPLRSEGLLPPHLDLRPNPAPIPKTLQRRAIDPIVMASMQPGASRPTTIFPPDDRRQFFDTSYPWSTCGRVDVAGGSGSGVMVGPRHLLTASHVINWGAKNTAGWVKFTPMLFDTSEPFGEAWGTIVYWKRKNTETLGWIDEQYDYVVVVLDWAIGGLTGWMGAKGYTDDWDHGKYWSHVGYPGDLSGAGRPTFQTDIALDGIWYEFDSHEAMSHHADVWPGQSGGPMFGWWDKEDYPSVVAVQSTQNHDENKSSGGQDMVDLIKKARKEYP